MEEQKKPMPSIAEGEQKSYAAKQERLNGRDEARKAEMEAAGKPRNEEKKQPPEEAHGNDAGAPVQPPAEGNVKPPAEEKKEEEKKSA